MSFAYDGVLNCNPPLVYGTLVSLVIDQENGFLYGGGSEHIVKVRLSDFTLVDSISIGAIDCRQEASAIDTTNGFAYFAAASGGTGFIVKVRLSDFTLVSTLTLSAGRASALVIDPEGGYLYAGIDDSALKRIVRIPLSTFTEDTYTTIAGGVLSGSGIKNGEYLYFGTYSGGSPVIWTISKIKISTFSEETTLSTSGGVERIVSEGAYFYAIIYNAFLSPRSQIHKIPISSFTIESTLQLSLPSSIDRAMTGFVHSNYLYVGTDEGIVIQVQLSNFTQKIYDDKSADYIQLYASAYSSLTQKGYFAAMSTSDYIDSYILRYSIDMELPISSILFLDEEPIVLV